MLGEIHGIAEVFTNFPSMKCRQYKFGEINSVAESSPGHNMVLAPVTKTYLQSYFLHFVSALISQNWHLIKGDLDFFWFLTRNITSEHLRPRFIY